jgi:hypothetical protein
VSEHLLSLDGSGREFIRRQRTRLLLPRQTRGLVERRAPDGPLLGALPASTKTIRWSMKSVVATSAPVGRDIVWSRCNRATNIATDTACG